MSGFPSHIWRKKVCALPIPHAQKVVLIALAEYADYHTGRDAWPGRARLMADACVGKGTVDRALNAGRKHGVIVQTASGRRGINPAFDLVRPDSAPLQTQEALQRPTTDVDSAPVVGHLPTHRPTHLDPSSAHKRVRGQADPGGSVRDSSVTKIVTDSPVRNLPTTSTAASGSVLDPDSSIPGHSPTSPSKAPEAAIAAGGAERSTKSAHSGTDRFGDQWLTGLPEAPTCYCGEPCARRTKRVPNRPTVRDWTCARGAPGGGKGKRCSFTTPLAPNRVAA